MPLDVVDSPNGPIQDTPGLQLSPAQLHAWIAQQQARLDAGLPLDKSGIPPGYKVDGGKIVEQNAWDTWGKGAALTVGGGLAAGFGAAALNGAFAAPAAEGAAATADGVLPSTTIGNGYIPAVSSTAGGGGSTGILWTAAKFLGFDPKNPQSYLDLAGKVGNAFGAAGKGAADGRVTQAGIQQRQDALEQQRYGNQLAGAQFALNAPKQRASNSVKGDILANAQDFAWGAPTMVGNIPVPTSTGGLRPSLFSDHTRALGQRMSSDALAGAKTGADNLPVPSLTPLPEAGMGSDILTTAGLFGGLADAFNPALSKLQSTIPLKRKPDPTMEMY